VSFSNFGRVLPQIIDNQTVAYMVSQSLKIEHTGDTSVIKNIALKSGANLGTIAKWYQAANAPKSAHLLMLASVYPQVLKGVLELIGRKDLWQTCVAEGIPEKMSAITTNIRASDSVYGDKYVQLNVVLNTNLALKLNLRQLWFVGEVGKGNKIDARELAAKWRKSLRTCRRDIRDLIDYRIIHYCGTPKPGHYTIKSGWFEKYR
jgi:hypothetical protein